MTLLKDIADTMMMVLVLVIADISIKDDCDFDEHDSCNDSMMTRMTMTGMRS